MKPFTFEHREQFGETILAMQDDQDDQKLNLRHTKGSDHAFIGIVHSIYCPCDECDDNHVIEEGLIAINREFAFLMAQVLLHYHETGEFPDA